MTLTLLVKESPLVFAERVGKSEPKWAQSLEDIARCYTSAAYNPLSGTEPDLLAKKNCELCWLIFFLDVYTTRAVTFCAGISTPYFSGSRGSYNAQQLDQKIY